ncbi:MAG: hypothetical protein ACTH90_06385 [Leuconostoc mesenteroides]|jgi:hypothetical protein|uniref:Uncharacterized protein n=3 Tax=Leuconostoc mesenteroides TaxID=1245 RepID=A0A843YYD1_LEUME|nr:hypothetical protein [Leuconostoc mesenteroides]ABJ62981.1 hypothetical protein LEUM_1907 [Leuconostoc mesenteroides subsp. mesenteroides ATCC 8293]ARN64306.1 hypothetical protein A0F18_09795 [Leuconostoc mesenteroides subsp. mesenteroides]MBZ1508471.1 hypothetical protein [Leuconostoc mesenteroides]MBZ1513267.1 hypothetical protein [Leuconostoc mesenteroides]MBZ1515420.1 hypothetical protein [Leuconostoc mesenteroides]
MTKHKQELKTQIVAYGWQLFIPENTIVMDNDQGNIAIEDSSDNFRGGPFIVLKVSENEVTVESSGIFDQGVSITLDKKIVIKRRPDIEIND